MTTTAVEQAHQNMDAATNNSLHRRCLDRCREKTLQKRAQQDSPRRQKYLSQTDETYKTPEQLKRPHVPGNFLIAPFDNLPLFLRNRIPSAESPTDEACRTNESTCRQSKSKQFSIMKWRLDSNFSCGSNRSSRRKGERRAWVLPGKRYRCEVLWRRPIGAAAWTGCRLQWRWS